MDHSRTIKDIAADLGFAFCGISKAEFLAEDAPRLEKWLKESNHGTMQWMENHFEKRLDPTLLVPGAKSVISVLYNYYTDEQQEDPKAPKFSIYAFGEDYHKVVKKKMKEFMQQITEKIGAVEGRFFVDSAPVMERSWAKKSGLGWIGKHSLLINKQRGSYFFLGELIIDLPLVPDDPIKDYCGTCTACIDACPTEAITPYVIDSNKCISYLTIELEENIPTEFKGKMENWAYGCDICQQVCPWNRFSSPHNESAFKPLDSFLNLSKDEWQNLSREKFTEMFRKTPVMRAGFEKVKQTIDFLG